MFHQFLKERNDRKSLLYTLSVRRFTSIYLFQVSDTLRSKELLISKLMKIETEL
jgi:hypothetical protein